MVFVRSSFLLKIKPLMCPDSLASIQELDRRCNSLISIWTFLKSVSITRPLIYSLHTPTIYSENLSTDQLTDPNRPLTNPNHLQSYPQSDPLTDRRNIPLIISGSVSPPVRGVLITLTSPDTPDLTLTQITDDSGEYSIGPLHNNLKYHVTASKVNWLNTSWTNSRRALILRLYL